MKVKMITTTDNPYDFFTHFNEWYAYDTTYGYNTLGFIARLAYTSNKLTDEENYEIMDAAIDDVIEITPPGLYKIIYGDYEERYADSNAF